MKLSILFSMLFVVTACGVKREPVDYGKTTVADLISERGEPLKKESVPIEKGEMLVYEDNEKFQVKGDIVTHGFKEPKGDEKALIFWKHKLKDCDSSTNKISEPKGHEVAEYELKCPEQGISVIYSEGSEFASRIIQYEKK